MSAFRTVLCISFMISGFVDVKAGKDGELRFEPEPFNKKFELHSSGKVHCKFAGGDNPVVTWYLNTEDPLPEGVSSVNGTLLVQGASHRHAGKYTCRVQDGQRVINATIQLDVVVSPRVLEPVAGSEVHVTRGDDVWLHCQATGDPAPTTHWDRNITIVSSSMDDVENEGDEYADTARIVLMKNGTMLLRNVSDDDSDRYACTAGNAAGLARNELTLTVHPEGVLDRGSSESGGVGGKAMVVSVAVAVAYMLLVLALMLYCRRRRLLRRRRGEKLEMEVVEGGEKLVEDGEEKVKVNGIGKQNGRLLAHERDSGADNSEVSAASRASKRSGHFDHLSVPRSLLTELITLGRGEFGDVMLGRIDVTQLKRLRSKEVGGDAEQRMRPVLVKVLNTKDENLLAEFRRTLDMFSRVRHERICRLFGLCNEAEPHYLLLEHTDWGDLKQFLSSTRSVSERAQYLSRVGPAAAPELRPVRTSAPLSPPHAAALALHLAQAGAALAHHRLTHRDIAARNCVISSKLQLKLSLPALTRGPHSHEYYKLHDQVIPLRWLPAEVVLEGDYSTKSDVYMFAVTVWEIYTKAELPFAKLNDNSVLERIRKGTLEWTTPDHMPEKMAVLLHKCWSKSPSDRPLFDNICEELVAIIKEVTAENAGHTSHEDIHEEDEEQESKAEA